MQKLLSIALLLAAPTFAFALAEESFGNAPVGNQPEWAQGVLDVVNLQSRVYRYWVNGNENFFFQGRDQALNEALRKYAAVKSEVRRLILLPGKGKQRSFSKGDIAYDWHFHVPSGIYRAVAKRTHAEMTVYINTRKPRELDDRKSIAKWLGDLDNDLFSTRERARIALEKLGNDAKPFLRDALKPQQTLETRRRIETLLLRLSDVDASDLELPKELQVVTPTDLVAIHL